MSFTYPGSLMLLLVSNVLSQGNQQPLKPASPTADPYGIPIYVDREFWGIPLYFARIGIGSKPVQHVEALLDLQWPTLHVVSSDCKKDNCNQWKDRYEYRKSETYAQKGKEMRMGWNPMEALEGRKVEDTVWLGSCGSVKNQDFAEVTEAGPAPPGWQWPYSALLGLSLGEGGDFYNWTHVEPVLPSVVKTLVLSDSVGGLPVFSLLLPRDEDQLGDLSFGKIHKDMYHGELLPHPIMPQDANAWQIAGPKIAIHAQNGTLLGSWDFSDHTTYLDLSSMAHILLPSRVRKAINEHLDADLFGRINCDLVRDQLSIHLTFDEQEIVLMPEDYIRDVFGLFGEEYCKAALEDVEMPDNELIAWKNESVVLGSPFLQAVYSVFNWEEKTVSCE